MAASVTQLVTRNADPMQAVASHLMQAHGLSSPPLVTRDRGQANQVRVFGWPNRPENLAPVKVGGVIYTIRPPAMP